MSTISVRLDPETESLLDQLARQRRATRSDVLREALHRLAESDEYKCAEPSGPYAAVADLIGIEEDGPEDLAANHKQVFRELIDASKPGS